MSFDSPEYLWPSCKGKERWGIAGTGAEMYLSFRVETTHDGGSALSSPVGKEAHWWL